MQAPSTASARQLPRKALWVLLLCIAGVTLAADDEPASVALNVLTGAAPEGHAIGMRRAERHVELSPEQRAAIWVRLKKQRRELAQDAATVTASAMAPMGWPLKSSPQLSDPGNSGISYFVDHDPGYPNALRDYQCGTRTYDWADGYAHRGVDYFTWPFGWLKMDKDQVLVVAGASGVILGKDDGNPDQSCGESGPWNAVYVQHDDGSIAWYGHLKKASLISKAVGERVAAGERLGVVGSSGGSTGPHLHMEMYDANDNLLDPYEGACNPGQDSLWKAQRPYYDSAINQATTGNVAPVFPSCPGIESPNISDNFSPGGRIYFTNYYRDQLSGQVSSYKVSRPDGSIHASWTGSLTAGNCSACWWYWWQTLPTNAPTGTWKYQVVYQGQTIERFFNVSSPTKVKVKAPNGGELVARGGSLNIKWQANIGGHLRIELWRDGKFYKTLALDTPNDGVEVWNVPSDFKTGNYKVKLVNLANEQVVDSSDKVFSVQ